MGKHFLKDERWIVQTQKSASQGLRHIPSKQPDSFTVPREENQFPKPEVKTTKSLMSSWDLTSALNEEEEEYVEIADVQEGKEAQQHEARQQKKQEKEPVVDPSNGKSHVKKRKTRKTDFWEKWWRSRQKSLMYLRHFHILQ